MATEQKKTLDKEIVMQAIIDSFKKLNPLTMVKNPVMFIVEVGTIITLILSLAPDAFGASTVSREYNIAVFLILFFTVLFANFAEALAEGRGKAQADTLRKTKSDTIAKLLQKDGYIKEVSSTQLRKGDIVRVDAGDIIPSDGEIIEGLASIDESAITGESAPVIKEAGGDFSSVTGGTRVVSDYIIVKVTTDPGESFLDRMISLVEGASRQKTPNEIALTTLLAVLTLIFLFVIITLVPLATYLNVTLDIATLIALLVCLIPTTIGGLLSAIGIAGMNRVTRFNVLAMSGKAVEAAGDIDTMILDKTGTITFGNRMAAEFIPIEGVSKQEATFAALQSSVKDETPEGRSIVELANSLEANWSEREYRDAEIIEFTAETRMSGLNLTDGTKIRKGAVDAIKKFVTEQNGSLPRDLEDKATCIAKAGGTPLAVAVDDKVFGVIYLKDTVKPGLKERFAELRAMGIKTMMCTGDNPLTAATIAQEAGVDEFIAEAKPEDKIAAIKREQAQGKLVAMTGDGTNDAPALAQADVRLAMNSGTMAAKEAANMIDLDSDPTKLLSVIEIGKQLLITRGALTTFSIANDIAKYFAIIPALFIMALPQLNALNIMNLASPQSAILSALIFNAVIIPLLIPVAMKGAKYRPMSANRLLSRNLFIYGLGGVAVPFIGIKLIDMILSGLL
ncbi:potassium-transporting ATPase subunit KdpB [Aneurinibacillus migulanus]|uniref:Potassium-transporting ATPase ATP-binding subunit n=1 Tax=Aneurinibacillus migulanus TaxID=47500 RepID=A0A0D1VYF7_ANEMI|nr:potassium-transporting ATPase subunit KdpB [Aneurinibacillus migulanus]KIV51250.1 potassium-transporting ATPase subunit B [Aneurinibacillus migulanus]KON94718.1 potassium-transporting ATPase subunit B [Aneurinibacillus migulanus]MED0894751.1 potassium-transporting ATPase subunit KdpB [Aneurinibacillus migulanus]MED1615239.1 potassium-transporting ATPase subunit KdpB [Aneurinibacillus migulanus]SDJ13168.1 K+-transporting ATPase ATPase B chain [Aneurinibacillus migulanus]